MSELLRLANELVEARDEATLGEWSRDEREIYLGDTRRIDYEYGEHEQSEADAEFIVQAANHAVDIIKGYQDLVRRMIDMLDTRIDYGHGLWKQRLYMLVNEAKASIPQENPNE